MFRVKDDDTKLLKVNVRENREASNANHKFSN